MKVYVVTETQGEYSDRWWTVKAAFSTETLAKDYISKQPKAPETGLEIEEVDVWDEPTEPMITFSAWEIVGPTRWTRKPNIHETVQVAPKNYKGFWVSTSNVEDRDGKPTGWTTIFVSAPTREHVRVEYERLLAEHQQRLQHEDAPAV